MYATRPLRIRKEILWSLILVGALVAFELFNFSTTEFALGTFFGGHDALGLVSWATVLAVAFCGIDFAGLSRLFTPETDWHKEPKEVRFLTAGWFLGALMNASMTWWAVTSTLTEAPLPGNEVVSRAQILNLVPLFVAALVWLTRVMLIGSLSVAGDHLFAGQRPARTVAPRPSLRGTARPDSALGGTRPSSLPEWVPGQSRAANRASTTRAYPERRYRPYPARARAADEPQAMPRRYDPQPARSVSPGGIPIPVATHELVYADLE